MISHRLKVYCKNSRKRIQIIKKFLKLRQRQAIHFSNIKFRCKFIHYSLFQLDFEIFRTIASFIKKNSGHSLKIKLIFIKFFRKILEIGEQMSWDRCLAESLLYHVHFVFSISRLVKYYPSFIYWTYIAIIIPLLILKATLHHFLTVVLILIRPPL